MSRPLTIIHVDDGREWRGGQHQVYLLACGLAERGIAQGVVCPPRSPLAQRLRESGIEVIALPIRGELDFSSARKIADFAHPGRTNIFHAHTSHAHGIALRSLRRARKHLDPSEVHLLIHRRVDFPVGGSFFSRRKYTFPDLRFIAISREVKRVLMEGGVAEHRIDVVHSGVPPVPADQRILREQVRRELDLADDQIAIINVGALTDHKGQRWLIEAAPRVLERFPNARFFIAGEGELREPLRAQAEQLAVADRVRLLGYVADIRQRLTGFDLYASSSHLEGLGTSVIDGIHAGLPVVAAAAGGITEVVHAGETGWLAPPRDGAALASAIIDALNDSPEQRAAVIERAHAHVERDYSVRQMVEGVLAVYQRLAAEKEMARS